MPFSTELASYLSIESHFVGVHGPYELHRKEEQIKCTALAVDIREREREIGCLTSHATIFQLYM